MKKDARGIISWRNHKVLFFISLFSEAILFGGLLYNVIKNYSLENLAGMIVVNALGIAGILAIFSLCFIWQIRVQDDAFVYRNNFGKTRKYNFSEITVYESEKYIGILDKDGKLIYQISYVLDNYCCLIDTYNSWKKTNIPLQIKNNTAKQNKYVRNFSITFLILGICFAVAALFCLITTNINDDKEMLGIFIAFLCMSFLFLIPGIIFLLAYKLWKIKIENNELLYKNILGKTKIYNLSKISKINRNITVLLYNENKRIAKYFIYFTDNTDIFNNIDIKNRP